MRISDWSSDVCSSDLDAVLLDVGLFLAVEAHADAAFERGGIVEAAARVAGQAVGRGVAHRRVSMRRPRRETGRINATARMGGATAAGTGLRPASARAAARSEEHTSELQSLMRTSYAA